MPASFWSTISPQFTSDFVNLVADWQKLSRAPIYLVNVRDESKDPRILIVDRKLSYGTTQSVFLSRVP